MQLWIKKERRGTKKTTRLKPCLFFYLPYSAIIILMTKKKKNLIFLGICLALVFLVYGHTLPGDFVFDDRSIVSHYSLFSNLNNIPEIVSMGYWTAESGLYRPVVLLSYALNSSFFGIGTYSFHLVNLILYAFTGYLLYLLIRKLFPKEETLAYLTVILFLVLPIHTEAVANIVGRAEILALFFSLLGFLEIIKKKSNIWLTALWLFLALGSKETAIAAWPIALLIVFYKDFLKVRPKKKISFKKILEKYFTPLFLSASAYFTARLLVLGPYFLITNASIVENPLKFASFWGRIGTALQVMVMYIRKTFWPFGLCSDYSYNQIPVVESFFNLKTLLGLAILLFFIITTISFLRRRPFLALGSAFFLFSFLVVSNLIFPIGTIAGERLMYYPSVGLCFYLAYGFVSLGRIKPKIFYKLSMVIFVILVIFYGSISFIRNFDWLTEKNLFISAAQCANNSVLSRSNMGTVYYFEGRYTEAEKEIKEANEIYDGYTKAINNLGLVYWKTNRPDEAKEEYFRAIRNWPPYEGVYENLILLELSLGNTDRAKKWINVIFNTQPEAVNIYLKKYGLK